MPKEKLPQVGDVIISPKFAYGYYDRESRKRIHVNGETKKYPYISWMDEEERVKIAAKTGRIPGKAKQVELGAFDKSRGNSHFVVESAVMTGGGTAHGPGDSYPGGWRVTARRLKKNRTYDPLGETIEFYMTGDFMGMIPSEDIRIVGKMKMQFV